MRIAIFIAGYLRSIEYNIDSIIENVIQNYQCDIYIHITKNPENDKYNNNKISLDYIQKKLNPKLILVEEDKIYKEYNNIYNQFYKFYKLNKIKDYTYDLIVKIRPDTYFHQKLDYNNIEDDIIYLPLDTKSDINIKNISGSSKRGDTNIKNNELCNIIAYGKENVMNKYFEIYNYLNDIITEEINNPETILYSYLNNYKIKYIKLDIEYSVILSLCNTIVITGDSGSGKSTLSKELSKLFKDSFILECDRYHKWERGNDNWKKITHLNPEANYLAKMEKDIFDLKIGKNIYQVEYDHNNGKFTDKKLIESKSNMIICGLHTLYGNLKHNIKIFIDTEEDLKIEWKLKRDIKERGYNREEILKKIKEREEDYIKYILPQKEKSDIIINYSLKIKKKDKIFSGSSLGGDKIVLNLGIKKEFKINYKSTKINIDDNFIWYYFDEDNYNKIILDFIKIIYFN
jgi:uridine kinase